MWFFLVSLNCDIGRSILSSNSHLGDSSLYPCCFTSQFWNWQWVIYNVGVQGVAAFQELKSQYCKGVKLRCRVLVEEMLEMSGLKIKIMAKRHPKKQKEVTVLRGFVRARKTTAHVLRPFRRGITKESFVFRNGYHHTWPWQASVTIQPFCLPSFPWPKRSLPWQTEWKEPDVLYWIDPLVKQCHATSLMRRQCEKNEKSLVT